MQHVYNRPWHLHCRCNLNLHVAPSPSPLNSLTSKVQSTTLKPSKKNVRGRPKWCDLTRKEQCNAATDAAFLSSSFSAILPHTKLLLWRFSLSSNLHISFLPFRSSPLFIPLGTEKAYYGVFTAGLQTAACSFNAHFSLPCLLGYPGLCPIRLH